MTNDSDRAMSHNVTLRTRFSADCEAADRAMSHNVTLSHDEVSQRAQERLGFATVGQALWVAREGTVVSIMRAGGCTPKPIFTVSSQLVGSAVRTVGIGWGSVRTADPTGEMQVDRHRLGIGPHSGPHG